jgi:uncharacterized protein
MNSRVNDILGELRRRFERLYGQSMKKMVLYGSYARDDAVEGSDIDVLVVLSGRVSPCEEIERTGDIVAEISLDHDVVISCYFVSEDEYAERRSPLMMNIRREGVSV